MPLNELFLILLGGYLFFTHFNGTRYRASGFPAQRLIFPSATIGLLLYVAARVLTDFYTLLKASPDTWLAHSVGRSVPVLSACLLASVALAGALRIPRVSTWVAERAVNFTPNDGAITRTQIVSAVSAVAGGAYLIFATWRASGQQFTEFVAGCTLYAALAVGGIIGLATLIRANTRWQFAALCFRITTVLLVVSMIGAAISAQPDVLPKFWAVASPLPNIDTPALACVLGIAAFLLGNLVLTPYAAASFQHLTDRTTELQKLVFESLVFRKVISLTLADSKVYVGWIHSSPPQSEAADGFLSIIPLISGYREKDSRDFTITTNYGEVYARLRDEVSSDDEMNEVLKQFAKVVRIADIKYAGEFDDEYYWNFVAGGRDGEEKQAAPPEGQKALVDDSG